MEAIAVLFLLPFIILGAYAIAALVGLIVAIPVFFLWNWLLPTLWPNIVPEITYWQAWGLYLLCAILFQSHATSNNSK